MAAAPGDAPPDVLRLAGHPVRWRLLHELAGSDRRVGELCDLTGERQSLVSYHLAEALAGRMPDGAIRAASAGSHPKPLHPLAVSVMRTRGIDIAHQESKHLRRFGGEQARRPGR
jgi:Bacterial regulatory protein, arsR family